MLFIIIQELSPDKRKKIYMNQKFNPEKYPK